MAFKFSQISQNNVYVWCRWMDCLSWPHVSVTGCVVGRSVLTYSWQQTSTASYGWVCSLIPHCSLYWCPDLVSYIRILNQQIPFIFHRISYAVQNSRFFVWQTLETAIEGEELVFLYQIRNGICQSSCAANIATLAGVPPAMVKRGVEVWH